MNKSPYSLAMTKKITNLGLGVKTSISKLTSRWWDLWNNRIQNENKKHHSHREILVVAKSKTNFFSKEKKVKNLHKISSRKEI